jgi:hypothetical protein
MGHVLVGLLDEARWPVSFGSMPEMERGLHGQHGQHF